MRILRWGSVVLLVHLGMGVAGAQITVPNTFTSGTTASAAQVNANFSALSTNALNRAGGTITGNIDVTGGVTIDGVDISALLCANCLDGTYINESELVIPESAISDGTILARVGADESITGNWSFGTITLTGLTCSGCVGSSQLASSGVSAGTYGTASAVGTFTVDGDGRLTSASALSIQLAETAITDGSLLARVGANETITGSWTFGTITVSGLTCTGCLGATQLATDAVTSAKILNGTIASADFAAGAVDATAIGTNAVGADEIATNAVDASELVATTVGAGSYGSAAGVATFTVDADGRLTAAGTTSISIAETQIQDGSLYARLAANETVAGTWSFSDINVSSLAQTAGGEFSKVWLSPNYLGSGSPAVVFEFLDGGVGSIPVTIYPQIMMTRAIAPGTDATYDLGFDDGGSNRARFRNIYLQLPENLNPSYVVVNKGSTGGDAAALGYISAGNRSIVIGGCTITVKAGLITNAVGC